MSFYANTPRMPWSIGYFIHHVCHALIIKYTGKIIKSLAYSDEWHLKIFGAGTRLQKNRVGHEFLAGIHVNLVAESFSISDKSAINKLLEEIQSVRLNFF